MKPRWDAALAGLCCAMAACEAASDLELAQVDLALDSADCTLGAACADLGPLIDEPLPSVQSCAPSGPALAMRWFRPLSAVACPFGECSLYTQQLSLDADGSLVSLGTVQLPSQHGSGVEGGLWLTRYASSGDLLGTGLLDFSAPPPGIEIERHAALRRDAEGRALLITSRAVLPFDAPRITRASRLSRGRVVVSTLPVFASAQGWGVATALDAHSNEWTVGAERGFGAEPHAVVTRYQRLGRVRWSRGWPVATKLVSVQSGPEQAVWALIGDSAADTHTLYKLDKRGNVIWRRVVASSQENTQLSVRADGSSVLASVEFADFFVNTRVLTLDATGHALAVVRIPDLFTANAQLTLAPSGEVALALGGFDADFLPVLDTYAFQGDGSCQRSSYQWPSNTSIFPDGLVVQADVSGALYFASPQAIGQLREGSAP